MYFSLVNRNGCIIPSLTPPAPNFHCSLVLSHSLSASYLWLYRGQIEDIILLGLNFLPCSDGEGPTLCPRQIKTSFYCCSQCSIHLLFPPLSATFALVLSLHFFLRIASLNVDMLTTDSLPQAAPSSGRDLHFMCTSLQF